MAKSKPLIPTDKLVDRLRLMASAGGMLTRDRIEAITQAADRLEEGIQTIQNPHADDNYGPGSPDDDFGLR